MSKSAFGVEHEISKGLIGPKPPKGYVEMLRRTAGKGPSGPKPVKQSVSKPKGPGVGTAPGGPSEWGKKMLREGKFAPKGPRNSGTRYNYTRTVDDIGW